MSQIHDEVKQRLDEVKSELKDIEDLAGHELVSLYNELGSVLAHVRAAKPQDYEDPETEAGEGLASGAGERHPEAVASEARPETAEQLHERADREPDPVVREKVRAAAESTERSSERAGTKKADKK